jgi:hypothetical protein
MKHIIFILIFSCLLCKNSFTQKISYKNLIGYWYNTDTLKRKFSVQFTDTFHLIILDSTYGISKGTYQLKTASSKTLLVITLNENGINHYDQYVITFIKPGKLKFENVDINDPIAQTNVLPINVFFIKKKLSQEK